MNVKLLEPAAAPLVMVVMTIYFGIRLFLEWRQSHPERRNAVAARADYAFANLIGASAMALYLVQRALQIQVATYFTALNLSRLGYFVVGAFYAYVAIRSVLRRPTGERLSAAFYFVLPISLGFTALGGPEQDRRSFLFALPWFASGFVVMGVARFISMRYFDDVMLFLLRRFPRLRR